MPTHRFSIVIPTRNRPYTLRFALQTCLAQQFEDFEVVVSDNHSPPSTREVVDTFNDRRLRYVRTPGPLSMTDSLEFASSQAVGEYVLFMGDDDGLLLHALSEADRLIRLFGMEVLRWDSVCYNWPDIRRQQYAAPDQLLIPLKQVGAHHPVHHCQAAGMMRAAANSEITYARLPMIYCSAIHRRFLDKLRQGSGRVFRSEAPDVYSSFAVAHAAGAFHSLSAPLNIVGLSGNSTGVACLYEKDSAIAEEFRQLNARAKHTRHPWVPALSVMAAYVADSFLHAREALFPGDDSIDLDRRRLIVNCLREVNANDEAEWQRTLEACRCSLADDPGLTAWFDAEQASRPLASAVAGGQQAVRKRYGGNYLQLDASDFGVSDTFGVAGLCEKILGYQRDGVNARLEEAALDNGPGLSELQEKEAIIQVLDKAAKERLVAINGLLAEKQGLLEHIVELENGFFARLTRKLTRKRRFSVTS